MHETPLSLLPPKSGNTIPYQNRTGSCQLQLARKSKGVGKPQRGLKPARKPDSPVGLVAGAPHGVAADGWVAERLKAPVLKTGRRESVSWVRIPPHPPRNVVLLNIILFLELVPTMAPNINHPLVLATCTASKAVGLFGASRHRSPIFQRADPNLALSVGRDHQRSAGPLDAAR
jgi:hypothetical protein